LIPLRDVNPTHRAPLVTLALIVACVVAFAWELGVLGSAGEAGLDSFFRAWGLIPSRLTGDPTAAAVSLVTSLFLHGGWLHLAGNLLYLWIFGNNIEDRLGRAPFLGFYLVGGALASLAHVAIAPSSDVPLVGASGAIAATLGAYVVLFPRARILSLVFLGFFYQLIEVPALLVLGFWFVIQLLSGFASIGETEAGGGVAFFAHIGGFVAGALAGLLIRGRGAGSVRPASVG